VAEKLRKKRQKNRRGRKIGKRSGKKRPDGEGPAGTRDTLLVCGPVPGGAGARIANHPSTKKGAERENKNLGNPEKGRLSPGTISRSKSETLDARSGMVGEGKIPRK